MCAHHRLQKSSAPEQLLDVPAEEGLRGGGNQTNYDPDNVAAATAALEKAKLPGMLMVDCSHANSAKDYRRQAAKATEIERLATDRPKTRLLVRPAAKQGQPNQAGAQTCGPRETRRPPAGAGGLRVGGEEAGALGANNQHKARHDR